MFVPERRCEPLLDGCGAVAAARRSLHNRLSRAGHNNARGGAQGSYLFRITQPLWPPRPIEFDSATRTSAFRASFGT